MRRTTPLRKGFGQQISAKTRTGDYPTDPKKPTRIFIKSRFSNKSKKQHLQTTKSKTKSLLFAKARFRRTNSETNWSRFDSGMNLRFRSSGVRTKAVSWKKNASTFLNGLNVKAQTSVVDHPSRLLLCMIINHCRGGEISLLRFLCLLYLLVWISVFLVWFLFFCCWVLVSFFGRKRPS